MDKWTALPGLTTYPQAYLLLATTTRIQTAGVVQFCSAHVVRNLSALDTDLNGNTYTFTWDAGQTPAFVVEIGTQPGASDAAVIEVDQKLAAEGGPLTWDPPAMGVGVALVDYFFRVRGKDDVEILPPSKACVPGTGGVGEPPCHIPPLQDLDLRAFIEALFLGDGPLSVGPPSGFMGGFPFGSQITVRFLNTVGPEWREAVRDLTGGCDEKLGGLPGDEAIPCAMGLTFTYSETSDRERMEDAIQGGPRPPQNEVWIYDTDGACRGLRSFTQKYYEAGSPVTWAAIICLPSSTDEYEAAHEMGHALGFQDLIRGLDIYSYMMRPASYHCSLSVYEFAAVELVYAAGLRPGVTRQDFTNAGLIEP